MEESLVDSTERKENQLNEDAESSKKRFKICGYPAHVFLILANEACERFNYYGFRTILTIYLISLGLSSNEASAVYSASNVITYFTPLIGAWLADQYFGRYNIIVSFSMVYMIGNVLLTWSAFNSSLILVGFALLLTGVGTGGIKPCVSSFGADQFIKGEERERESFFNIFYMAINIGSIFSCFITPILAEDIYCLGKSSCYPLAFFVPAVLMLLSIVFFLMGTPWYRHQIPEGDMTTRFIGCSVSAVRAKFCRPESASMSKDIVKMHNYGSHSKRDSSIEYSTGQIETWLDYADSKYERSFVSDCKSIYSLLWIMIPFPFFWMLYDQQGDSWVIQGESMDGSLGFYTLSSSQMTTLNPLLIVFLIPIFESFIYPFLDQHNILGTLPLGRMVLGFFFLGLSFICAACLQIAISMSSTELNLLWQIPQYTIYTIGEILFSPTGLAFSYAEAPVSMRSVMTALFLFTVSIGDLIDVVVFASNMFSNYIVEYFVMAGCMFGVTIVFYLMSKRYKYVGSYS